MRTVLLILVVIALIVLIGYQLYLLSSSVFAITEKIHIFGGDLFYAVGGIFLVLILLLYLIKKMKG